MCIGIYRSIIAKLDETSLSEKLGKRSYWTHFIPMLSDQFVGCMANAGASGAFNYTLHSYSSVPCGPAAFVLFFVVVSRLIEAS